MKKLKEVTVFTSGDSSKISTWSNVPFFFTETLLAKGIKINRVDISPSPLLEKLIYSNFYRIVKRLHKGLEYDYFHSYINFIDIRSRIKKAVKQYENSDVDIFLSFSFSSSGLTQKPIILFCDWPYDHHISYLLGKNPDFFENQCIKREELQIREANLVFSLFPSIAEYMTKRYAREVQYLGNVINSLYDASKEDIDAKATSHSLLFIGSKKYLEGAETLLTVFQKIKINYPRVVLHIIGMQAVDFTFIPPDVFCHGYLDKGKDAERTLYYQLLKEASVFVNTTPKWSSFSASVEAMYFYTPIIVTPYTEFVQTFGENIAFGYYCAENSAALLEEKLMMLMHNPDYKSLCSNAHAAVQEFTWDAYMDKIIQQIEQKLN